MKKKTDESFLECIAEIVLSIICLFLGAFIVGLFGLDIDNENLDFDLLVLIGIVSLFSVGGIVYILILLIKKLRKKLNQNNDIPEEKEK